jgi:hypothetical protein
LATFTSLGPDAVSAWCTCRNGKVIPTIPTLPHGGWPCPKSDIPQQVTINHGPVVTQTTSGDVYECFQTRKDTDALPTSGGWATIMTTFTEVRRPSILVRVTNTDELTSRAVYWLDEGRFHPPNANSANRGIHGLWSVCWPNGHIIRCRSLVQCQQRDHEVVYEHSNKWCHWLSKLGND